MTADKTPWFGNHVVIYRSMLLDLLVDPPGPSVKTFLERRAAPWFRMSTNPPQGYVGTEYRNVDEGELVKFWDGSALSDRSFDEQFYWVGHYTLLAQKVIAMGQLVGRTPFILDLGAGTGMLAFALRAAGYNWPVFNLEFLKEASDIAEKLGKTFGLKNIINGHVDINEALSSPEDAENLAQTILKYADDMPIIAVSRYAIFPFYGPDEYERLFDFVVKRLGAVAGVHDEMCGFKTPTFERIKAVLPVKIGPKIDQPGDVFGYLEQRTDIKVHERLEVWPHFVTQTFPSYLSWLRR